MKLHTFNAELWLPEKRDVVFSLFADAVNLETITPPWLSFAIVTPEPIEMYSGARIDYQLRVHGLPVRWKTEISIWDPPYRFVDKQLCGPYRRWVHTHTFEQRDGGTLCRDHVEYAVPGGRFINWLLVRRDVVKIFAYRQESLLGRFRAGTVSHRTPLTASSVGRSERLIEPSLSSNKSID